MGFKLKKACQNCPFRKDVNMQLRPERAREIASGVIHENKTFTCHKTLSDDKIKEQQCVGALLAVEKAGTPNQMFQIVERLGLYNSSSINRDVEVFGSVSEMEAHYA
ncbi:hypothetical protein JCM30760_26640 [Thiomicrorhabdus hydrogeniphila]